MVHLFAIDVRPASVVIVVLVRNEEVQQVSTSTCLRVTLRKSYTN